MTKRTLIIMLSVLPSCQDAKKVDAIDAEPTSSPTPGASSSPPLVSAAPTSAAPLASPDSVACQHVLVAYKGAKNAPPNVSRSKAEAKTRAEDVRTRALASQDFTVLAQTYSDDPGSRDRMGSVGKFKREGMVKPFSDAAFALKIDGISDVVETPFGFHVIKRNQ